LNAKPELQWQILNKKKLSKNCVIFKSEILQKLWIFPQMSIVNEAPELYNITFCGTAVPICGGLSSSTLHNFTIS
jgi:hypothetical protein